MEQISEFLSGRITNYKDWLDVGMALSTLSENGRKYFVKISQSKKYNDSEQEINKKYSELLKSARGQITIATLFHVAKKYGYKPQAPKNPGK
ncbi:MAG: PriCT-2 domain-containing protein [Ignavibacteriales bacterium]|nr:PriCT-2 domain-containing protein [Ignavibacteriales bacterium]